MPRIRLPFDPITRAALLWVQRWGNGSQAVPMATATSVMRVQQLLLTDYDATCARHGLSFARYEALVLLAFSREGRLGMTKIGERLMVHPTSATNIVQRLHAQGFVDRVPNPVDGRGSLAVITPAGLAAMEAATADLTGTRFGLAMLTGEEHEQLFTILRKIRLANGDFVDEPVSADSAPLRERPSRRS